MQGEKGRRGRRAYDKEAELGLTDLITQCHVMAEWLNVDFDTLKTVGDTRFVDRMKEVENEEI